MRDRRAAGRRAGITCPRVRLLFCAVILVSTLMNAYPIARVVAGGYRDPNAVNTAVIRTVRERGLTKGYAQYFTGNINTYLSGYQTQFIPTTCGPDGFHVYHWLMDDVMVHRPASRTFFTVAFLNGHWIE